MNVVCEVSIGLFCSKIVHFRTMEYMGYWRKLSEVRESWLIYWKYYNVHLSFPRTDTLYVEPPRQKPRGSGACQYFGVDQQIGNLLGVYDCGRVVEVTLSHFGKLPSVTHILFFQTACKMTLRQCIVAGPVSTNKTIVYYLLAQKFKSHNFLEAERYKPVFF